MKHSNNLALGLSIALALGPAGALAASVSSLLQNGVNVASDENREYLIDRNWNGITYGNAGSNAGILDEGDSLRGLVNFSTLNSIAGNLGGTTGNNEWSGVFQAVVVDKAAIGAGGFSYTFAPDPAFAADLSGGIGPAVGFAPGAGALVVFYEDSTPDAAGDFNSPAPATPPAGPDDGGAPAGTLGSRYAPTAVVGGAGNRVSDVSDPTLKATEEAFIATAADGTHFWTLGFLGPDGLPGTGDEGDAGAGEGWSAISLGPPIGFGDDITVGFTVSSGVGGVNFNVGMSRLLNGNAGTGDPVDLNKVIAGAFGPTEFAWTGSSRGVNDLDTPFEISSDFTVTFDATVPEPGTISLLGLGLVGIGAAYRRRRGVQSS